MDFAQMLAAFHAKFGDTQWVKDNPKLHSEMMRFRMKQIAEEYFELQTAYFDRDAEEFNDAAIDLTYFLLGTLDLAGVDINAAFLSVHTANMAKESGVKVGRANPLNLPDRTKPDDWEGPSHQGNHGNLPSFLNSKHSQTKRE